MAGVKLISETPDSAVFEVPSGERVVAPVGTPQHAFYKSQVDVIPVGDVPAGYSEEVVEGAPVSPEEAAMAMPAAPQAAMGSSAVPMSEVQTQVMPAIDPGSIPPPVAQSVPMMAAPAMPPMITESQSSTRTGTKSEKMDPKLVKKWEDADAALAESIKTQADAQIAQNNVMAGEQQIIADAQEFYAKENADRQQRVMDNAQKRLVDVDTKIAELSDAKIDPNRVWGSMETGNKMSAVASLFLGAFGAGATGAQNAAMDVLNKAIDRDIDAQKANLQTKKDVISSQRNALSDYLQITGDEDAARKSIQIQYLDSMKGRMESIALTSKNPVMKANAEAAAMKLNQESAQKRAELSKQIISQEEVKESKTAMAKSEKLGDLPAAIQEKLVTATNYTTSLQDLSKEYEMLKQVTGPIAGRWNEIKAKLGLQDATQAEAQQRIISIIAEKVRAASGAAATDAERAFLSSAVPTLKDNPEAFMAKLNGELKRVEKDYDNMYKMYEGKYQLPNRVVETQSRRNEKEKNLGIKRN